MSPDERPAEMARSPDQARERVRIEPVRVRELVAFVDRYLRTGASQAVTPLTPQRALSQSQNPHANADDVGLLVAYVGSTCVGYQGLLPVSFVGTSGGESTVMWSTSMFVLPEYRDRLVALQLVRAAINENVELVLNEFSDEAGKLFRGLRFQEMPALEFLRLRVDLLNVLGHPLQLLGRSPTRARLLRAVAARGLRLTRRTGYFGVRPLYYALLSRLTRLPDGFECRAVDRVRELPIAEREHLPPARFARGIQTVNWMLETPWVRDDRPPTAPPYYFADTSELFRYVALEILDANRRYRGFIVLSVRREDGRTTLKLLDRQLAHDLPRDVIRAVSLRYAREHGADVVDLPLDLDASLGRLPLRRLLLRTVERPYLCRASDDASPLVADRLRLRPSLADGDTAFW